MSDRTGDSAGARSFWPLVLAGAAILGITFGARITTALFISPINTSTGAGLETISLALAIGQLVWGVAQPLFGMLADRRGPVLVIALGGMLIAAGMGLTTVAHSGLTLILTMGIVTAAGAGAGSFSTLLAAAAQRLPAERRAFASGFINAGGSVGQFIYARGTQILIDAFGWVNAMLVVAASTLLTLPLCLPLRGEKKSATPSNQAAAAATAVASEPVPRLKDQIKQALGDRSYVLLHLGFFTCGFHVAFLSTHLPGEIALCGLPAAVAATSLGMIGLFNILGSLTAGAAASRWRFKSILSAFYAARAVIILVYLFAPKSALTFYILAAALGFTWLATVPTTAGVVAKLFGTRYLATLFGLTMVSHQIGGFFGAWLGGVARVHTGNYEWMWYADILLAVAAALINLPIREAPLPARIQPA